MAASWRERAKGEGGERRGEKRAPVPAVDFIGGGLPSMPQRAKGAGLQGRLASKGGVLAYLLPYNG
ncbi:hypothetical protein E2562_027092 [Oryza meyeriana var. granulata]|uniref:Uncharacterized protein n=1 Tax=Oryza meyeriana var. granulata TaxID=110450 RepID=A0A6G1EZ97_9ORYZ|nr:hypothetical protein E2562_027092 [Oryza meyeriana var. granulata]